MEIYVIVATCWNEQESFTHIVYAGTDRTQGLEYFEYYIFPLPTNQVAYIQTWKDGRRASEELL